jgi:hypothetical protein
VVEITNEVRYLKEIDEETQGKIQKGRRRMGKEREKAVIMRQLASSC